jgi:hypothetical protein
VDWKFRRNPKLLAEKRMFIHGGNATSRRTGYRPFTYIEVRTSPLPP